MLNHHDDRPPGALAHGATKPSDIERVRGDIARAQQRVARGLQAASTHDGQRASTRAALPGVRIAATAGPCTPPLSLPANRPTGHARATT